MRCLDALNQARKLSDELRVSFELGVYGAARVLALSEAIVAHTGHPTLAPSLTCLDTFLRPRTRTLETEKPVPSRARTPMFLFALLC